MIATEFGPLGGPLTPSSWRDETEVPLLAVVIVVFKFGGVFPGWSPWSTDLCGSNMAKMSEVIPVTRNCGTTIKMFCMPWWSQKCMKKSVPGLEGRRSTDQNDARLRTQTLSGSRGSPILKRVLPRVREIYPAAAGVDISHENILVAVSFYFVLVAVAVAVAIDIFSLDCEQFLVLLVRAGISEKDRLVIVDVGLPGNRIWCGMDRLRQL